MTYLATNPLFHGISPETLSRDFDGIVSHLRMFRKGDILARQGDVCNDFFFLQLLPLTGFVSQWR